MRRVGLCLSDPCGLCSACFGTLMWEFAATYPLTRLLLFLISYTQDDEARVARLFQTAPQAGISLSQRSLDWKSLASALQQRSEQVCVIRVAHGFCFFLPSGSQGHFCCTDISLRVSACVRVHVCLRVHACACKQGSLLACRK